MGKRKMCRFFFKGHCANGFQCPLAHLRDEPQSEASTSWETPRRKAAASIVRRILFDVSRTMLASLVQSEVEHAQPRVDCDQDYLMDPVEVKYDKFDDLPQCTTGDVQKGIRDLGPIDLTDLRWYIRLHPDIAMVCSIVPCRVSHLIFRC